MRKYHLEFILNIRPLSLKNLKGAITEFGEGLEIIELPCHEDANTADFQIRIYTENPEIIFDNCAQFGQIKTVKID